METKAIKQRCPICSSVDVSFIKTLMVFPPKYEYICNNCGEYFTLNRDCHVGIEGHYKFAINTINSWPDWKKEMSLKMINMATGKDNVLPIHPGETLREIMVNKIHEDIVDVLNYKKDITPSLAVALEKLLGVDKSFWLNLQANYDKECL